MKSEKTMVPGWDFEKKVTVPVHRHDSSKVDWSKVLTIFNDLQTSDGDLYMKVSKLPLPTGLDRYHIGFKQWRTRWEHSTEVTFQHRRVYNWFLRLAYKLGCTTGEAVAKTLYDKENLREELGLGQSVNVDIREYKTEVQRIEDAKVNRKELEELIDDD